MHFTKQIPPHAFNPSELYLKRLQQQLSLDFLSPNLFSPTMKVLEGLWLCLSFGCAASCLSAQFRRPGDFILGGLFPFGKDTVNLTARSEPTQLRCER